MQIGIFKNKFFLLSAVLMIAGCQFKKDDAGVSEASPKSPMETKAGDLKAEFSPEVEIGSYQINFSWKDLNECEPQIQYRFANTDRSEVRNMLQGVRDLRIHQIPDDQELIVTLNCIIGGSVHPVQTINVKTPNDLVVDKVIRVNVTEDHLSKDFEWISGTSIRGVFGRLYFAKGGEIIIGNKDLEIQVGLLRFDDGAIRSYPKGQDNTTVGNSGLNGGNLVVIAEIASGVIDIDLSGERGGKGLPGNAWQSNPPRKKGASGKNSVYELAAIPKHCPRDAECAEEYGVECKTNPTSGGQGEDGLVGQPGNPGMPGGSAGSVKVKVIKKGGFQIAATLNGGEGGEGGDGGQGSLGGEGGDPGSVEPSANLAKYKILKKCSSAASGPRGNSPVGPVGTKGKDGLNGIVLQWVLELDQYERVN